MTILRHILCVSVLAAACGIVQAESAESITGRMCAEYEQIIRNRLWDKDGVMICYFDIKTMKPFEQAYFEKQSTSVIWQNRADFFVYEDSFCIMGIYLDMLKSRYDVTKDSKAVSEMERICRLFVDTFEDSQKIERGFHKRLYGGIGANRPWEEPLGTDQHVYVLPGCWKVYNLLSPELRNKVKHMTTESLLWYMRKGYRYIYNNYIYHEIEPVPDTMKSKMQACFEGPHALSYYLPALLWCHELTGEKRYIDDYNWMMDRYVRKASAEMHERQFNRWAGLFMAYQLAPEKDKQTWAGIVDELMIPYMTVMKRIAENNGIGPQFEKWLNPQWDAVKADTLPRTIREMVRENPDTTITDYLRYCPLMQVRDMLDYARMRPGKADIGSLKQILLCAGTPSHFAMYYDPSFSIMPENLDYYARWGMGHSYVAWVASYYRLKSMNEF